MLLHMSSQGPHIDIPVELRFRDLDAYGHVNNAAYFTLMESARVKFLHRYYQKAFSSGPLFFVARASCDFKRPLGFGEGVTVRLRASRFGRSSFYLTYEIMGEDLTIYAEGETRMVCVDRETQRPTQVPEDFRSILEGQEEGA